MRKKERGDKGVKKKGGESWTVEKQHHRSTVHVLIHDNQVVLSAGSHTRRRKEEEERK